MQSKPNEVETVDNDDMLIGMYIEATAWQRELADTAYDAHAYAQLRERAYARVIAITEQFTSITWAELHARRG